MVIVHVFYPEIWAELAACIGNVVSAAEATGTSLPQIVVTYVDEAAVREARRDFPNARFILCENRGYDVWPFLKALQTVNLDDYDLVVKLHTKRDVEYPHRIVVCNTLINGPRWREHLLAFIKTPKAWARTLRCFEKPRVGLVADRHVIYQRRDALRPAYEASFDTARKTLNGEWGLAVPPDARFAGGTMFAVRAALLKPFVAHPFTPDQFAVSGGHDTETLAHVVERMFGLVVCGQGFRVVAFNGSVTFRRIYHMVGRFFFDNRRSTRRHSIRIFKITVYRKKLQE